MLPHIRFLHELSPLSSIRWVLLPALFCTRSGEEPIWMPDWGPWELATKNDGDKLACPVHELTARKQPGPRDSTIWVQGDSASLSLPRARSSQTICFPKIIAPNYGSVIGDAFLASPDKQEHNLGYSENRRGRA
jgi:hypothetical protein